MKEEKRKVKVRMKNEKAKKEGRKKKGWRRKGKNVSAPKYSGDVSNVLLYFLRGKCWIIIFMKQYFVVHV